MTSSERISLVKKYLGKTVKIKIDRPLGYIHKKEKYTLEYPINYGYIPGVTGGDGEELDVYLLGEDKPVSEYTCRIIGAVLRKNDVEDKLIAAPIGKYYTEAEMYSEIKFQEQWYDTDIISVGNDLIPHYVVGEKQDAVYYDRAGVYMLPEKDGMLGLIRTDRGYFFIGGGLNDGESDSECLAREIMEETGYTAEIGELFATAEEYKTSQPEIGYFHPMQYYYTGKLIEKVAEPIESDHILEWVKPEDAAKNMFLEMQKKIIFEKLR